MTQISIYYIDAFTDQLFGGNPAAVCLLPNWLDEERLHNIAKENNQSVTAFLVRDKAKFDIRWITPEYELDICGHGTLSAAFVIFNFIEPQCTKVVLHSRNQPLIVSCVNELITLNFPTKPVESCTLTYLIEGLGSEPHEVYQHKNERCLAVFNTEKDIQHLTPDMQILKKLAHRGITVTAAGAEVDFVSRTFYPKKMISEDPATGASHCLLVPYWAKRLNKTELHAKQLSQRGGEIFCEYQNDRVLVKGKAVLYMQGNISL